LMLSVIPESRIMGGSFELAGCGVRRQFIFLWGYD
jgi:hypothetical protein